MVHPMGVTRGGVLRLDFDRRLMLEFHGSKVTSDAGSLPYREPDDALGLTDISEDVLTDTRGGKNARRGLAGQFHQSVLGRLGGFDDAMSSPNLTNNGRFSVTKLGLILSTAIAVRIGGWARNERTA
jgi:hypothetical protein